MKFSFFLSLLFLIGFFPENSRCDNSNETETETEHIEAEISPPRKSFKNGKEMYRTILRRKILGSNYDKYNIPDDLKVDLALTLMSYDLDNCTGLFNAIIWVSYDWNDTRLVWNSDEYNITHLNIPPDQVWTPDIVLYNSETPENNFPCAKTNIVLTSNGKVSLISPCRYVTHCIVSEEESFECILKFGSWTYDGSALDLGLPNDETDVSSLSKNPKYNITSNFATLNKMYYGCCDEPYLDITFNLHFKKLDQISN